MVNAVAKYQKYAEYKDSEVEWLGEIPSHWAVIQLKRLGKFITGMTPSTSMESYYSDEITEYGWIRPEDILETSDKVKASKYLTKLGWDTQRPIPAQSIAICGIGTIGKLAFIENEVVTNQQITSFIPSNINFAKYYYYLLTASRKQLEQLSTGNVVKILNSERLGSLWLPLLNSVEDANKIANFLDHETAKIDSLIEKQQKLIELLKEKRQAVISHAVTKGLNPDVPMKDSGVEWLGQVPEHWELVPLKHLCTFSGGGTPTKDNLSYWTDGTIPWVSPKDMKTFWLNETQDYITEKAVKESSTNMVEPHSLLMVVRSGILQRTIPIAINTVPVTMNQDMKALKFSKRVIVEYIADLIHGNTAQLLLEWSKDGATVESIEHEYLANSVMPVPPLDEQEAIVEMIARKMQVYKDLTSKAEEQIILLQERRTALISSAVTGKIDVRNWQNPNNNNEAQMELSQ